LRTEGALAAPQAAGATAPAGLVRLETTDTCTRPYSEEQRTLQAQRRALKLFKSLSCTGDLHRVHVDARGRRLQGAFLTLTYAPHVNWAPNHMTECCKRIRQYLARRGIEARYVWCAEQHKSGRVHYHAIWFLPPGIALPKPDKQGWWPHGLTRIERCRKQSVGYLIKYATKCRDVTRPWPKHCRLHGHGGLDKCERERRSWWVLPKYIRELVTPDLRVRRANGGGWVSPVTGELWPPWRYGLPYPSWGRELTC